MSKKTRAAVKAAEKAERSKFAEWMEARSQKPGGWVLKGGYEGEGAWALEGWRARAALEAEKQAQLRSRVAALEAEVARLRAANSKAAVANSPA